MRTAGFETRKVSEVRASNVASGEAAYATEPIPITIMNCKGHQQLPTVTLDNKEI